ncbi:hypothetical protein Thpro_022094 [Acidihalobacter prosperus]|uniref:Uncharacterized protein n=1 Tax=Acidihalobacter prosperus TaxID=160660 RepID=A0A1A6C333_9GAMM|nr:hypothetical protein Thpro_022094 [Acidihalobacter prosperus]
MDHGPAPLQQEPRPLLRARHQGPLVFVDHKDCHVFLQKTPLRAL